MSGSWRVRRLTDGTAAGRHHSHSYYDIPVFDSGSRYLAGWATTFSGRHPLPDDRVEVGVVDLDGDGRWTPVGESGAWSWQQGPLAQWLPGSRTLVWNDRDENGRFVARLHDLGSGARRTLPRPIYALDPRGRFALSLDFARLDALRPGYGYPPGERRPRCEAAPADDGIWRLDLETGQRRLILSSADALAALLRSVGVLRRLRHRRGRLLYWFNHVKIAPDGRRFTVKLRFRGRAEGSPWSDAQGASLTCGVDGADLRVLAHGTSHAMWWDANHLYLWQRDGVSVYRDAEDGGRRLRRLAPGTITGNVHLRHFPSDPDLFVFDTPYVADPELLIYSEREGRARRIARFENHVPERGPFRCDLHPVPAPSGARIAVTSPADGGRQIYLLERT